MSRRLTAPQVEALQRARDSGHAYADLPRAKRRGGAYRRMVTRLGAGLLLSQSAPFVLTEAGRKALEALS